MNERIHVVLIIFPLANRKRARSTLAVAKATCSFLLLAPLTPSDLNITYTKLSIFLSAAVAAHSTLWQFVAGVECCSSLDKHFIN